jgi:hypothetical protein
MSDKKPRHQWGNPVKMGIKDVHTCPHCTAKKIISHLAYGKPETTYHLNGKKLNTYPKCIIIKLK